MYIFHFLVIKSWIRIWIGIQPEMLNPDTSKECGSETQVNTEYSIADFYRIRIQLGPWIHIRTEEGKNGSSNKVQRFEGLNVISR